LLNKLFRGDPEFFSAVIDNLVLVGVLVDGVGTSGGGKEIGEEINYRYL